VRAEGMTSRSPYGQGLLVGVAQLSWRIHWGPRDSTRGHRGIISWRIWAVVPHRCGCWRHLDIGLRSNPERGHVEENPAAKMRVVKMPKLVRRNEMMVAKAPTVKSTMSRDCESVGNASHEAEQDHHEHPDGFVHTRSPFS